jgi:hypothetical protein
MVKYFTMLKSHPRKALGFLVFYQNTAVGAPIDSPKG